MLKAKYYPWVLIIIFSLLFGLQVDFWCGLAVGYMWHYGLFSKCSLGSAKATEWESRFPFKVWAEKEWFVKAGASMGGEVTNVGAVLNRNGASSSFPAPGNPSGSGSNPATANSSNATFKSFSGKGVSLGGANPAPSAGTISSMLGRSGGSNSRGRSTPETRAAADPENKRPRNLAHESKLVMQSKGNNSSATTTVAGTATSSLAGNEDDLEGPPIEPQDNQRRRTDDKCGGEYQNLTMESNNSTE